MQKLDRKIIRFSATCKNFFIKFFAHLLKKSKKISQIKKSFVKFFLCISKNSLENFLARLKIRVKNFFVLILITNKSLFYTYLDEKHQKNKVLR